MPMGKAVNLRFLVRAADGRESSSWGLWVNGSDVYLAWRSPAEAAKLSFHASGICRSAIRKEHTSPELIARLGGDRVITKWRRPPIPPVGMGASASVVFIEIPTDYLSMPTPRAKKHLIINAAPSGMTSVLHLGFTAEPLDALNMGEGGTVLAYYQLPAGYAVCLRGFPFGSVIDDHQLRAPGDKQDWEFLPNDYAETGRPLRILINLSPKDGEPMRMKELGGWPTR